MSDASLQGKSLTDRLSDVEAEIANLWDHVRNAPQPQSADVSGVMGEIHKLWAHVGGHNDSMTTVSVDKTGKQVEEGSDAAVDTADVRAVAHQGVAPLDESGEVAHVPSAGVQTQS